MAEPLYPQVIVECQFTDGTWTDISPWVRGVTINRGCSRVESPIIRYDAGTATIRLDNRDRRFDPTNLAGPYTQSFEADTGIKFFTCSRTLTFGQGWTVDVKSATGQVATVRAVSSKATGTTGSSSVPKPAGTQPGDLLVAFHFADVGTLADMGTPTGGATWNLLASRTEGDDTFSCKVWRKTAGSSEPSAYTFTQNTSADGVIIIVAVQAGTWDTGTAPVVASTSNPETSFFATPATTPPGSSSLEIRAAAGTGAFGRCAWESPKEWEERADTQSNVYTTATLAVKQLTGQVGGGTDTRVKPGRPMRVRARLPFTPTTNLIKNPSFEVDTTGWGSNGTSEIGRDPGVSRFGGWAGSVAKTEGASIVNIELVAPHTLSIPAGTQVTISAYVMIPAAVYPALSAIFIADATFDGAIDGAFAEMPPGPDVWHRVTWSGKVKSGKTLTRFQIQFWTDGSHATGQVIAYVDGVQVETGVTAPTPYCDGSQPACTWLGAEHASASTRPAQFTFDLFRGFVDDWLVEWERTYDSEVTVPCTDGLGVAADYERDPVSPVGAGETTGARVHRILDSIGWPATDRVIAAGDSTVQATTLEGDALSELQLVADTEIGELYCDGSGRVVFRNRHALITDTRSTTPQARFGEGGPAKGRLPYHEVVIAYDRSQMANIVRISRAGGTPQTAIDQNSIDEYRARTFTRDDLVMQSDAEALAAAQWVLYISREPELRFDQLVIRPEKDPETLFPQVLSREIGDRIIVERQPPGGGEQVVRQVFIRGIQHEIRGGGGDGPRWETTWTLQSATRVGSFLTLGHPELGRIGSNALVY